MSLDPAAAVVPGCRHKSHPSIFDRYHDHLYFINNIHNNLKTLYSPKQYVRSLRACPRQSLLAVLNFAATNARSHRLIAALRPVP